jgi:hypothetical protein
VVEFRIKVHPEQRLAYIPKEIYEVLGSDLKAVGNRTAVIFFPENATIQDVLKSLAIIRADFKHALQLQKKEIEQK